MMWRIWVGESGDVGRGYVCDDRGSVHEKTYEEMRESKKEREREREREEKEREEKEREEREREEREGSGSHELPFHGHCIGFLASFSGFE
jgi:SET domain-containing protein